MNGPDPANPHPMEGFAQVCFIRNTVKNPAIIVGGNPARPIRARFDPETVARLEALAWWDWPIDAVTRHLELIVAADVDALAAVAPGA